MDALNTQLHTAGKGIAGEQSLCFLWFQRSAAHFVPEATYKLAQCYEDGWGCTRDMQEAVALYKEAAEGTLAASEHRSMTVLRMSAGYGADLHADPSVEPSSTKVANPVAACYVSCSGLCNNGFSQTSGQMLLS